MLLATSVLTGCGQEPDEPVERTATAAQPIMNGITDTTGIYTGVVGIHRQGSNHSPFCSGVLVTPYWVLTAAHCFLDDNDLDFSVHDSYFISAAWDQSSGPGPTTFPHREEVSGPVFLFGNSSPCGGGTPCDDDAVAADIALFRLDRRVPSTVSRPIHLNFGPDDDVPPCVWGDDEFVAVGVGFGNNDFDYGNCDDSGQGTRRYMPFFNWHRSVEDPGSMFVRYEDFDFVQPCGSYAGFAHGDSGGGVLSLVPPLRVCGIISGHNMSFSGMANKAAAVDANFQLDPDVFAGSAEFLESTTAPDGIGIVDPQGNFLGECPAWTTYCYEGSVLCDESDSDVDVNGNPAPDGIIDMCDNCPWMPNWDQLWGFDVDSDGDGLKDSCDNCPNDKNWGPLYDDQLDSDQDGVGNACDNCPCDPDPTHQDQDGDGLCEVECGGPVVDLCPAVYDPEQQNCNRCTELILGEQEWPNSCDPVPCPENIGTPWYEEIDNHPDCGNTMQPMIVRHDNRITIQPWGSHHGPVDNLFDLQFLPVPDVPTHVRWCQDDAGLFNIDCNSFFAHRDARLFTDSQCAPSVGNLLPCGFAGTEQPTDYYHRMTFQPGGCNGSNFTWAPPVPITYDVHAPLGFNPDPPHTCTWRWGEDTARWVDTGLIDASYVENGVFTNHDQLHGTLLIQADTPVGKDLSPTGYHGPELAKHHQHDFAPATYQCTANPKFAKLKHEAMIKWPEIPHEPGPDWGGVWLRRWDAVQRETTLVAAVQGGDIVMLDRNGGGQVITNQVSAALAASLTDPDIVWATRAEPFFAVGGGYTFPLAAGMGSFGSQVVELVASDGATLYSQSEGPSCAGDTVPCGGCESGFCLAGPFPTCCELGCSRGTIIVCPDGMICDSESDRCVPIPRTGSPHAEGYVAVLSRVGGGIFVIGGTDPDTDAPTGEIWFTRPGETTWEPVASGITVDQVLAATYSFATRELFVLDESAGMARLWALRRPGSGTRLLGSWPRHPAWSRHWLVVDRSGDVLLASAKLSGKKEHAIARFDVRAQGGDLVVGAMRGKRALLFEPIADGAGYTLALQKSLSHACQVGQGCEVKIERFAELPLVPAVLADVGAQL